MGYIPIDRKIFDHFLWTEERAFSRFEAWLDLIQLVSFKDGNKRMINGEIIEWKRGQYPISLTFLVFRWRWNVNSVRSFLALLKKHKMIITETTGRITVLTLCNYELYNACPQGEHTDRPHSKTHSNHMVSTVIKERESRLTNEESINKKKYEEIFKIFWNLYPGNRRGFEVEFENLTKRHKNWFEIIPILSDNLTYQINAREVLRENGGFVPVWKNLQTWINQKCWTEEISTNNISITTNGINQKNSGATTREIAELMARKYGVDSPEAR